MGGGGYRYRWTGPFFLQKLIVNVTRSVPAPMLKIFSMIDLQHLGISSSDYIFTGSGTLWWMKWFSVVGKLAEFPISENHFPILDIHFLIAKYELNFLYQKFIFQYWKFIFRYRKFLWFSGIGKWISDIGNYMGNSFSNIGKWSLFAWNACINRGEGAIWMSSN